MNNFNEGPPNVNGDFAARRAAERANRVSNHFVNISNTETLELYLLLMVIASQHFYNKLKHRLCPRLEDGRWFRQDFTRNEFNQVYEIVANYREGFGVHTTSSLSIDADLMDSLISKWVSQGMLIPDRAREITDWLLQDIRELRIPEELYTTLPKSPLFLKWIEERAAEHERRRLDPNTLGRMPLAEDYRRSYEAIRRARDDGSSKLTARRPSDFMTMEFNGYDVILENNLFVRDRSLVIAGASGVGKSLLLMQFIAAVVSRKTFLNFQTHGSHLRWLMLQTENSNRRLKDQLSHLRPWMGEEGWVRFDQQVIIHSIENEVDAFMHLSDPGTVSRLTDLVEESQPDIICVDPLRDFATGNLNEDVGMTLTLQQLSQVCRHRKPGRGLVILHHALTGREGAAKAIGFDRSSFNRNSKVLHGWTRGQINVAQVEPDNNERLIIGCGKNSDGREFKPFGIKRDRVTLIYDVDPSFDLESWQQRVQHNIPDAGPSVSSEQVAALCPVPTPTKNVAKSIMEAAGCKRSAAFNYINRAVQSGKVLYTNSGHTEVVQASIQVVDVRPSAAS